MDHTQEVQGRARGGGHLEGDPLTTRSPLRADDDRIARCVEPSGPDVDQRVRWWPRGPVGGSSIAITPSRAGRRGPQTMWPEPARTAGGAQRPSSSTYDALGFTGRSRLAALDARECRRDEAGRHRRPGWFEMP